MRMRGMIFHIFLPAFFRARAASRITPTTTYRGSRGLAVQFIMKKFSFAPWIHLGGNGIGCEKLQSCAFAKLTYINISVPYQKQIRGDYVINSPIWHKCLMPGYKRFYITRFSSGMCPNNEGRTRTRTVGQKSCWMMRPDMATSAALPPHCPQPTP